MNLAPTSKAAFLELRCSHRQLSIAIDYRGQKLMSMLQLSAPLSTIAPWISAASKPRLAWLGLAVLSHTEPCLGMRDYAQARNGKGCCMA